MTLTFRDGPTYSDTHDTDIDEQNPNDVNGDSTSVGWDMDGGDWGLLRFGSIVGSNSDQIPEGAEVMSATLALVTIDSSSSQNPGHMRRVLVPWNETASWAVFSGGSIDGTEMDTSSFIDAPTSQGPQLLDVTSFVSDWVSDPATNHGWIVEPMSTNGISFRSSEAANEAERPTLEVTFLP